MRIGLISDIHGDPRALETTLRRLEALAVDRIVCAGDLVGYGSDPDGAVALIRAEGIPSIRGNHDRWALERRQLLGLRGWKPADLLDETWEFLEGLPTSYRFEGDRRTVEVHHGSPASDMEFVTSYKPLPPSVEEFWGRSNAQYLILGHTHVPMIDRGPWGTVLNPGSLMGVPGTQTSYTFATLELKDGAIRIYEVRTGREIRRDPIHLDDEGL